jgi:hypothetical protein
MELASPPTTPSDVAAGITQAWAAFLQRDRRPADPHPYVYASAWRPCERRMVLEMTEPAAIPPWPADVLAKFRRGNDRERDLLADLMQIGRDADPPFTIIGQQQRFRLKDHKSRVAIVGKVDAQIEVRAGDTRAPLEVKAWSPLLVDRIETFADLFESPWTRSGGYQLLSYLYGAGLPFGFLLLDRSGLPALIPVELDQHLDKLEDFLARAERALDHVEAGTLPDYLENDPAECQRCPFYGSTCNPPLSAPGAVVLTDPELERALERREELKAAAKEFDALDDRIKKQLRGVERGVAGAFLLSGRWGKQSRIEMPADLKAQYTVTDPKGRFTLEIARLGEQK